MSNIKKILYENSGLKAGEASGSYFDTSSNKFVATKFTINTASIGSLNGLLVATNGNVTGNLTTIPEENNYIVSNGTAFTASKAIGTSPTNAATGDLTGSFPNPSVKSVANVISGVLGAAYGGTGLSSMTNNTILIGNGTGSFQQVTTGSSGSILKFSGSWSASSYTPTTTVNFYNSGSFVWTKPSIANYVRVIAQGGGGGGGGGCRNSGIAGNRGGGGGGSGGISEITILAALLPASVSGSAGLGGTGGTTSGTVATAGTDGTDGGDSFFGTASDSWRLVATGGGGGKGGPASGTAGGVGGTGGFGSWSNGSAGGDGGYGGPNGSGFAGTSNNNGSSGGGGGAGGGLSAGALVSYAGSAGGAVVSSSLYHSDLAGGTAGPNSGTRNGGNGLSGSFTFGLTTDSNSTTISSGVGTGGGGGATAQSTITGSRGGDGVYGSGGGGGGCALNASTSVQGGGNGGNGWVIVITW
jgi:hypothetical protein